MNQQFCIPPRFFDQLREKSPRIAADPSLVLAYLCALHELSNPQDRRAALIDLETESLRPQLLQLDDLLPDPEAKRIEQALTVVSPRVISGTSLPTPIRAKTSSREPIFTSSQTAAFDYLNQLVSVFLAREWRNDGLQPRFRPLIVGSTGVGKNHLIRELAKSRKLPVAKYNFGEWSVLAGLGGAPTINKIAEFVRLNTHGIIHLDELDKFQIDRGDNYSRMVGQEMFAFLDGQISSGVWDSRTNDRLRSRFLIVGTGTWQQLWENTEKQLGFGSVSAPDDLCASLTARIQKEDTIPKELWARFDDRMTFLLPPSVADLRRIAVKAGLQKLARTLNRQIDYEAGARSGRGLRWLETTYTDLLHSRHKTNSERERAS